MDDDLYVLDMGDPIRVLDLARLMITLAGRVPDREIPITFTGLRPGEKLHERLMTDVEAKSSRRFQPGILAVDGALPPADLDERLDTLGVAAAAADRGRILDLLREMVLSYTPSSATGSYRTGEVPGPVLAGPDRRLR